MLCIYVLRSQKGLAKYHHYRNQLDGKGLCCLPRTAKGSGKVGYGKELLCRLLSEADGKGAFAISGGRERKPTAINVLLVR